MNGKNPGLQKMMHVTCPFIYVLLLIDIFHEHKTETEDNYTGGADMKWNTPIICQGFIDTITKATELNQS